MITVSLTVTPARPTPPRTTMVDLMPCGSSSSRLMLVKLPRAKNAVSALEPSGFPDQAARALMKCLAYGPVFKVPSSRRTWGATTVACNSVA
jgi:hypothetical protein